MDVIFDLKTLREKIRFWKKDGLSISFVPTMGNLHAGHLSLISGASEKGDKTIVSIFVNPIQFGHGEDYEKYPSTLDHDLTKLGDESVDMVFAPNLNELYPAGIESDTRVTIPALSEILCGKFRPGHFSGVATVVMKLFNNVQPDFSFFGAKDFQQILVIRRMVEDLLLPIEIVSMPIIREIDGLAMSSRNSYLSKVERVTSVEIYSVLVQAAKSLSEGFTSIDEIETQSISTLAQKGFDVEYCSIRQSSDLATPVAGNKNLVILMAAWLGDTRLIDNIRVDLD
jgi:pantoate--beta-alanine ligase